MTKPNLFWFTATILDGQVVTLNEDTLIMPTSRLFSKQFPRLVFLPLRILQWPNGSPSGPAFIFFTSFSPR